MLDKKAIVQLIESHLEDGQFLVQLSIDEQNNINVFVDAMQGFPISECIRITKLIEAEFDREEEDYALQVSSAGLDLPLFIPQQYKKNIGEELNITQKDGTKIIGTLLQFEDPIATVEAEEKITVEGKKRKQLIKKQYQLDINTDIKTAKPEISLKRYKKK